MSDVLMIFHGFSWDFHGIFMGFSWDFMGFHGIYWYVTVFHGMYTIENCVFQPISSLLKHPSTKPQWRGWNHWLTPPAKACQAGRRHSNPEMSGQILSIKTAAHVGINIYHHNFKCNDLEHHQSVNLYMYIYICVYIYILYDVCVFPLSQE